MARMRESTTIDCVIPAAGSSTRMGRPKLLLPLGEGTVLGATVGHALAAGLRVILVTGPEASAIEELARGWNGVVLARNEDPSRGMLSSIQAGVRLVRSERFFVIPADMPFVGPELFGILADAPAAGPVFPLFRGSRGHPVLIPSSLVPAILALPPEQPLRPLLQASGPSFVEIEDAAILRDLDTMEEYRAAIGR
jgi:molybdenum cofactor cytidylyltransferase